MNAEIDDYLIIPEDGWYRLEWPTMGTHKLIEVIEMKPQTLTSYKKQPEKVNNKLSIIDKAMYYFLVGMVILTISDLKIVHHLLINIFK